ncbi:MAG: hypothetical protein WA197_10545 [Candidatus Acidiferrales bacterium]
MKTVRLGLFVTLLVVVLVIAVAWNAAHTRASHSQSQPVSPRQVAVVPQNAPMPLVSVQPASLQQPPAPGIATPAGVAEEKTTEERLGPFAISGNNYSVVLHKKHLAASEDGQVASADGVVAMEIVDAAGTVQYQRTHPLWADGEGVSAWEVFAHILKGTNGTGLLVRSRPSESSGFYEQIFGIVNDKLVPFCGPFPAMDVKPDANGVYRTVGPLGPQADEIPVMMGTGRFVIAIPIRLDWAQGKLTLAPQCPELAAGNAHAMCQYEMVDPKSFLQKPKSVTFVRLYSSPNENSGKPERVIVNPASQIDLLAYLADMELKQPDFLHAPLPKEFPVKDMASIGIAPNSDGWLQVRIDGKVGWIHGNEDLDAVGLPEPQDEIN